MEFSPRVPSNPECLCGFPSLPRPTPTLAFVNKWCGLCCEEKKRRNRMQGKQRSLREEAQDDSCGADLELLVQMEAGEPGAPGGVSQR